MSNLALKYRPKTLDEIVGQDRLLGKEGILRKLIESNRLGHTFLHGPPGCGKTTLARVIATTLDRPFYEMNATSLKIEEVRKIFKTYQNALQKPLIFIDEVHRLSKNQQEVLLPFMENNAECCTYHWSIDREPLLQHDSRYAFTFTPFCA